MASENLAVCEGVANKFPFVFEGLGPGDARNTFEPVPSRRVRRPDAIATDALGVSVPEIRLHRARWPKGFRQALQ